MTLFKLLGKKATIEILLNIHYKKKQTYSEIEAIVGNPRTTSERLKSLVILKIINRKILNSKYRNVEYSLTALGHKIVSHIIDLEKMMEK